MRVAERVSRCILFVRKSRTVTCLTQTHFLFHTVIESVISRLHRLVESRQKQLRIVGLSATLPNYKDVAEFLHVPERGLFYFGPEYRPVPLQQTFVGVMGNVKNRKLIEDKMNDVCYEQVKDALARVSEENDYGAFLLVLHLNRSAE